MKWYNNGWYNDNYEKGVYVNKETYDKLNDEEVLGKGYISTDENGFPYIKPYEETDDQKIRRAKYNLSITDWQVIKALENLLLGNTELHKIRQKLRDEINELENK